MGLSLQFCVIICKHFTYSTGLSMHDHIWCHCQIQSNSAICLLKDPAKWYFRIPYFYCFIIYNMYIYKHVFIITNSLSTSKVFNFENG